MLYNMSLFGLSQIHYRRSPTTPAAALMTESKYIRMIGQNRPYDFPLDPNPLAVDNPQRIDAAFKAHLNIIKNNIFNFARLELM